MLDIQTLDFEKGDGVLPAIVQDVRTNRVLMLGYMNRAAAEATLESGLVTFYSRSRATLWTKGETSGNTLRLGSMHADCDRDSLLVFAEPAGPTCHQGSTSCFGNEADSFTLATLEQTISKRIDGGDEMSYVRSLSDSGVDRCAQKVGEEAVEVVIAAKNREPKPLLEESADLLFHLMVLLQVRGRSIFDVVDVLRARSTEASCSPGTNDVHSSP